MENLMLKFPTNEKIVRVLQDAETSAPAAGFVARLRATPDSVSRGVPVAATAIAATMGTIALIAVFALHPTYSLAQVATALTRADHYTVSYTEFQPKNSVTVREVKYQVGGKWRSELQSSDGKATAYTVGSASGTMHVVDSATVKFVSYDGPTVVGSGAETSVDNLLRLGGKPSVERNVEWNGKHVDRFRVSGKYKPMNSMINYREEVMVDPVTKLPEHVHMELDDPDCPKVDDWDYDYASPDASLVSPQIPADAMVYDLRKEREQLSISVADQPVGAIILGHRGDSIALLADAPPKRDYNPVLTVDGANKPMKGMVVNVFDTLKPNSMVEAFQTSENLNTLATIRIGGKDWYAVRFFAEEDVPGKNVGELMKKSVTSGSIKYLKSSISFKNVPVIRTSGEMTLVNGFESHPGVNWLK
jgi:hypothetical protein